MQNAIKLENISNLITSPSSYQSQESEVLSIIRYRGTSKIAGFFLVAQRSSRCPYTLLLIELPTPVYQCRKSMTSYMKVSGFCYVMHFHYISY